MRTSEQAVDELRRRGELWEEMPGLTGLRGETLHLAQRIDEELRAICALESHDEWSAPPMLSFDTLARADYFAAFPQWLTGAAHLDAGEAELGAIAESPEPADRAAAALRAVPVALQPAVCYHAYARLAGARIAEPVTCTLSGTCWRHERDGFRALERGWAFTMREVVCIGTSSDVAGFRARCFDHAADLACRLGLRSSLQQAFDPFFAPTARGRALLQRVRALKHELHLPIGPERTVAAASFNDHATFFGHAFDIRLQDGTPATTGCAAFGLERWLLAVLVEHGTDPRDWPLQSTFSVAEMRAAW